MNYRKLASFFVVVLLASLLHAQLAPAPDAAQLAPQSKVVKAPPSAPSSEVQTVVLKMAAPPVAVVKAGMPGKLLTESQRLAIVKNIRAQQAPLIPSIQAMGGTVLATFQHAINGIKVQAPADRIAAMAKLPGVIAVKRVATYELDNALSVPYIGAPSAWNVPPGFKGGHVKVAVIDSGIDYTHANFGGLGTAAAYTAAHATSTLPADPNYFGPAAPKVKGGIDLVGDAYTGSNTPVPDPNPLDCGGHGSHVAGTVAGFGVTTAGTTYGGPYDLTTPTQNFIIGPGVAPEADLYAVRVFGCSGTTNVVVDALDWSLANGMQVASMSLGANFGNEDTADAEASENLVNAGIIVVAASGNAGGFSYITSSPATGQKAISVAAIDSHTTYPAANLLLSPSGITITVQDSNGYPFQDGTTYPGVVVLPLTAGGWSGCDPQQYIDANVQGKLVVTVRGSCARVARAIFGQQAGAAAVVMINNQAGYPTYEGPITSNPDTGIPYTVTIPFFGALQADGPALNAATSATANNTSPLINPTAGQLASFSSIGPRIGDGHLKPEIAAPGVSIYSTYMGTGYQGLYESGTSMATPHVAGVGALTAQAHPGWSASDLANAVVNTGSTTKLVGYSATGEGNGLVQPYPAVLTSVTARAADGTSALSFGVAEFTTDYTGSQTATLVNHGASPASFSVAVQQSSGSPHTATPSVSSVTVPANGTATVKLTVNVPIATNGDYTAFRHVEGRLVFTPTAGNNNVVLSVPYYVVTRARSAVAAKFNGSLSSGSTTVNVSNATGQVGTTTAFYSWGQAATSQNLYAIGLRAVGVRSYVSSGNQNLQFAVSTLGRISTFDITEIDIWVDTNNDGTPDKVIVAYDYGLLTTGTRSGTVGVAVFNADFTGGIIRYYATWGTDQSTILMTVRASDLGITAANPRFQYFTVSNDNSYGVQDILPTWAKFNAFGSAIGVPSPVSVPAGAAGNLSVTYNSAEAANTPALGMMVVPLDNKTGNGSQALLLPKN